MIMSNEDLDEYTNYMAGKSLSTIRQYRARINTLYTHFEKPITDINITEFVDFCKGKGRPLNVPLNPNTSSQYINALNKYWNMKGKAPTDFIEYRSKVLDGDIQKHTRKTNDALRSALPTMQSVLDNEKLHLKNGNSRAYMRCYLCREFYTRNMDLDVKIITNKSELNDEGNFLLIQKRPNRVEYIRNSYKTVAKYGTKTFTIKDKAFMKMCETASKKGGDELYLFPNRPTEPVNDNNQRDWRNYEAQTAKILKRSLGGIGEGLLLKIQVNNIADKSELLAIEEARGTSVSYLMRSYNVDAPQTSKLHESVFYVDEDEKKTTPVVSDEETSSSEC